MALTEKCCWKQGRKVDYVGEEGRVVVVGVATELVDSRQERPPN